MLLVEKIKKMIEKKLKLRMSIVKEGIGEKEYLVVNENVIVGTFKEKTLGKWILFYGHCFTSISPSSIKKFLKKLGGHLKIEEKDIIRINFSKSNSGLLRLNVLFRMEKPVHLLTFSILEEQPG